MSGSRLSIALFLLVAGWGVVSSPVQADESCLPEDRVAINAPQERALLCGSDRCCAVLTVSEPTLLGNDTVRLVGLLRGSRSGDRPPREEAWLLTGSDTPTQQLLAVGGRMAINQPRDPDGGWQLQITTKTLQVSYVPFRPTRTSSWEFIGSPFRLVRERQTNQSAAWGVGGAPPFYDMMWDWDRVMGKGWLLEQGTARQDRHAFVPIPWIDASNDLIQEGWKTYALGGAGLDLGSALTPGSLLAGSRLPAGKVLKVLVVSERDLLIDLPRTAFTTSENWNTSDHIEIWQVQPGDAATWKDLRGGHWGIRASDGRVFRGWGNVGQDPTVERVTKPGAVGADITGFKIRLPWPLSDGSQLAVSYGASLDGKKLFSLVSTSDIRYGQLATVGLVKKIPPHLVRLRVENQTINLDLDQQWKPDVAAAGR